jgi:hypothetical protein
MAVTRARLVLAVVWGVAALAVAILAWLLFGLSEEQGERAAGLLLLGVAVVAAVIAIVVLTGRSVRRISLAGSAVLVVGGLVAAVILAADGGAFLADLLLVGAVPIIAGVVTALLAPRT